MHTKGFKIKKYTYLYVIIFFAILSSVLRVTDNGMTSFYRLFAPLIALGCIVRYFKRFKTELLLFFLMLIYSSFVSVIFLNHIQIDQVIFTVYVFILYIIIKEIKKEDRSFENNMWRFIHVITTITIVLAWIQRYIHYTLPYLDPPMKTGAMSVYFTNENELSAALSAVFVVYLYILLFTKTKKTPLFFFNAISIPIIGYLNDAKISLLGIIIAAFLFLLYYFRKKGLLSRFRDKLYFKIIIITTIATIIILFIWNPLIKARDYSISIREMLFDWIIAIFRGEATGGLGTYEERSSAIIYGFREYFKTYGFGMGIGNTVYMLSWTQYFLRYAKSMHNIILQFLIELGYFAAIVYVFAVRRIIFYFKSIHISEAYLLKAVFFVAIIFISSQSSVGFLSNYLELVVIMFIALMDVEKFVTSQKGLNMIKKRSDEKRV